LRKYNASNCVVFEAPVFAIFCHKLPQNAASSGKKLAKKIDPEKSHVGLYSTMNIRVFLIFEITGESFSTTTVVKESF
jgi:hypothetical protein